MLHCPNQMFDCELLHQSLESSINIGGKSILRLVKGIIDSPIFWQTVLAAQCNQ